MSTEAEQFVDTLRDGSEIGQVPKISRSTLLAIATFMQERPTSPTSHRRCYVGQVKLAHRAGKSERTLRSHLNLLESRRIIVRTRIAVDGNGRRGVGETILIVGHVGPADRPAIIAARSGLEAKNDETTKRQASSDQAASLGAPTGNSSSAYRETRVITQIDQVREDGLTIENDAGPIPANWRSEDLTLLWENQPFLPLANWVVWLWALEHKHGANGVTDALARTRTKIASGRVANVRAYIETAAANNVGGGASIPPTATVHLSDFGPTSFAKASAALLKTLEAC